MATPTAKLAQRMTTVADAWSLARHPKLTPGAVQAATALQKGEPKKRHPLSAKMLRPASTPHYYDRLLEGYSKSQQGIARPWWKVFFGVW